MRRLAFLLFLAACSSTNTYSQGVQNWVGQPESLLLESWGEPDNVFEIAPGQEVYTYIKVGDKPVGGNTQPYADTEVYYPAIATPDYLPSDANPYSSLYYCKTLFTVSDGTITDVSFNGDDCV